MDGIRRILVLGAAPHTRVTNSVIPHTNYEDQLLILETGDIRTASTSLHLERANNRVPTNLTRNIRRLL